MEDHTGAISSYPGAAGSEKLRGEVPAGGTGVGGRVVKRAAPAPCRRRFRSVFPALFQGSSFFPFHLPVAKDRRAAKFIFDTTRYVRLSGDA